MLAQVFQSDAGKSQIGAIRRRVTVDAYPGRTFPGAWITSFLNFDMTTRTLPVRLVFPNSLKLNLECT